MLTNATIAEVRPAISQQCLNPSLRSIAKHPHRDAVIAQSKSYAMRVLKLRLPSSLVAWTDEV